MGRDSEDKSIGKHAREVVAQGRSSTPASTPSVGAIQAIASENQIKRHLAELSLFCHHQGMTEKQAALKLALCVGDLRRARVSDDALAIACERLRTSPNPDHRFFNLGFLLAFCRQAERELAQARRPAIPAIPGPVAVELPEHPCPVPRLAGRTEEDERVMSLEQTIGSLTKTREEVPEEVVVSLDSVRGKYPPRKIGVRKGGDAA